MKYLLNRALLNFKSSKKIYIFFFFEIILAGIIMNIFMGMNYSMEKVLEKTEMDKQSTNTKIDSNSEMRENDYYFTHNDYEYLKEKYKHKLSISYTVREQIYWDNDEHGESVYIELIFANDDFFKMNFGKDIVGFDEGESVYVGREVMDKFLEIDGHIKDYDFKVNEVYDLLVPLYMDEERFIFRDKSFKLKKLSSIIGEKSEGRIEHYPSYYVNPKESSHIYVDLKNTIVIPLKYSYGIEEALMSEKYPCDNMVLIKSFEDSESDNNNYKIYSYLKEKHQGRFDYRFVSKLVKIRRRAEKQRATIQIINIVLMFCMIVIIIGINGLMLMNINRRKRSIAIAICTGANNNHIMKEIFLETLAITIPPALVAVIISWVIGTYMIKINGMKYMIPGYSYILFIIISIVVAVISAIMPIRKMKKFMPLEILNNSN